MIGRKKERYLQKKADRRPQCQQGRIPRLPLHRGNHGKALLALKGALNHFFLVFETLTKRPFVFLPLFRLHVDGQNDEIHHETHDEYGFPPVGRFTVPPHERRVHPIFQRRNKQRIQEIKHDPLRLIGLPF